MSTNLTRFVALLIIINFFRLVPSVDRGYYTIVAPGVVRSQSVYQVSVSLSDFNQSCWFNLTLLIVPESPILLGTVEIQPKTTKLFELKTPFLNGTRGSLEVIGYRGIISKDHSDINIQQRPYSVFIQTSKPKYKPGELVQFRVIFVDLLTRPANVKEEISVLIYDGSGNLLKQFSDVKLVQGVFKNEIQLSEYPVLGKWKIEVYADGDIGDKSFEVARYVLPKFSVKIDTKPNVAISEGLISLTVSASYFYKEPVKGNLTLHMNSSYAAFGDHLPSLTKQYEIDGQVNITLPLTIDTTKHKTSFKLYTLYVKAIVTDELTEQQSTATVEIGLHTKPYKVKLQAPQLFVDSDKPHSVKVLVSVTDLEDIPIRDIKTPVKITSECASGLDITKTESLHQHVMENFLLNITHPEIAECELYGEYQGTKSHAIWTRKNINSFSLEILTKSPEVGKELQFELKSKKPIEYFAYEVVARGTILQAGHINVPANQSSYILRVNATHAMVPKVAVFVHRTKNLIFDSDVKDVFIKREFQNSIKIETVDEVRPGASVNVNVTTDEGSYVGIMGIDQNLLQGNVNEKDLTEDDIYKKLLNFDASSIDNNPGVKAGLITLSNALTQVGFRVGEDDKVFSGHAAPAFADIRPLKEMPMIRKLFSESWIFKDFERSPKEGLRLQETIPDSITSWAITGFSLNPNTGLALTKNATELKVFQKFFISMDLPSFVKAGESIEVPIYISNYMSKDAMTNISFEKFSEDLEIVENVGTNIKPGQTTSKLIPKKERVKFVVVMKPLKAGKFKVVVKAISGSASDAIEKVLNVVSEGIANVVSKKYLIHFLQDSIQEDAVPIELPTNIVPGSESFEISVVGDVFRPLMESLKKLVRVPYGNGEDNMRFFITNLSVLKYLKAFNYSNVSLETRIRFNLELGYQNQLNFKHLDGSFGRFDRKTERTGDIWQTAFALWGLKQANSYIKIDKKVLDRAFGYLKSKQLNSGSFKSGASIQEDVKLTAFIMMSFLINQSTRNSYEDVVTKSLSFLYEKLDSLEHSSTSVLATYVLLLGKHAKSSELMTKLRSSSQLASKQLFWTKSDTLKSQLEETAGSLLILFESQKKPRSSLLHIVSGLISSKGYESTATHMIALQAMIAFVGEMDLSRKGLSITFDNEKGTSGSFHVNSTNAQVLQTFELSPDSRKIKLKSQGYGFAIVDVKCRYNLLPQYQASPMYLTNITTHNSSKYLTVLHICLAVSTNTNQNNVTIVEVNLQSGYSFSEKIPDEEEGEGEELTMDAKTIRINNNRDVAVAYFENIDNNGACLQLEALRVYKVINSKPGIVVSYDAYQEDQKTVNSFTINDPEESWLWN